MDCARQIERINICCRRFSDFHSAEKKKFEGFFGWFADSSTRSSPIHSLGDFYTIFYVISTCEFHFIFNFTTGMYFLLLWHTLDFIDISFSTSTHHMLVRGIEMSSRLRRGEMFLALFFVLTYWLFIREFDNPFYVSTAHLPTLECMYLVVHVVWQQTWRRWRINHAQIFHNFFSKKHFLLTFLYLFFGFSGFCTFPIAKMLRDQAKYFFNDLATS